MKIRRIETIYQLEKCTFIMDKLLEWQKLRDSASYFKTSDFKRLTQELGDELTGYMRELTRNLKEWRLKEKGNED